MRTRLIQILAMFCVTYQGFALDPHTRITQYSHTAWRLQDGVFESAPNAVTQTADGYIWIGTGSGLVKYDGARFEPWLPPPGQDLPDPNITSIHGSSDGTLWIGTARGLLSWKNKELRQHLKYRINDIVEDQKGTIWAVQSRSQMSGGLCRLTGDNPSCFGGDGEARLPHAVTLADDRRGGLWVGGSFELLQWNGGFVRSYFREELTRRRAPNGVESIAVAADGSVWVSIPSVRELGLVHIVDGRPKRLVLGGVKEQAFPVLFVDRMNALWLGTFNDGIYRLYQGQVDHFRSEDGLSSNTINNFFEDREGNLWVTTSRGLDFFRENRVLTFSTREGLPADNVGAVLASNDGTVWVGNRGSLDAIRSGGVTSIALPGKRVTALMEDHTKRLWVGIDDSLSIYEHGQFRQVKRPDGRPLGIITALAEDREHNIWAVANPARTLFRIRDLRVLEEFSPPQIPLPRLVTPDPSGGVWLGFVGKLGHYRLGKVELLADIPAVSLTAAPDGSLFAATTKGLVRWKHGKVETLTSRNGLKCSSITSATYDDQSTLWLHTKCGLIGISDSEIERWWKEPGIIIKGIVLDALDGARASSGTFHPVATKSPDGRLWFSSEPVVQVFDPKVVRQQSAVPPVYVEKVRADRKDYPLEGARLPPHPGEIEVSYTALSYSIPQRVRFRYKLEPRDEEWRDLGTRRQAFFSDLPPGLYRFHVTASGSDGVWNETGAALEFQILPAYYQTRLFYALCAAACLTAVWGLYRLRLYQIRREFSAQLDGRVDERLRVARDLHDTLLQSFQAALIQLQVARSSFARSPEKAVQSLDKAIRTAAQAIADGRGAIQNLRVQPEDEADLAERLTAASHELARAEGAPARPPAFSVTVEGERRELATRLQDEIFRIICELLRNAFRHAEARCIEVEIRYGTHELRVHVRDDGKGIDPEVLAAGGRAGHFGLPGARERANQFGATLEFWSEEGAGTEVVLAVPAAQAYAGHRRRALSFLWRDKAGV